MSHWLRYPWRSEDAELESRKLVEGPTVDEVEILRVRMDWDVKVGVLHVNGGGP